MSTGSIFCRHTSSLLDEAHEPVVRRFLCVRNRGIMSSRGAGGGLSSSMLGTVLGVSGHCAGELAVCCCVLEIMHV